MDALIAAARADRSDAAKRLAIIQTLMQRDVYVIPNPGSDNKTMTLMEFPGHEKMIIPVFSDRAAFAEEARGTGYEGKAIPISPSKFASLLSASDTVIVNAGDRPGLEFSGSEIKALVHPAQ